MDRSTEVLLRRIESAWHDLADSYAGLSAAEMTRPGVVGDWSVKDVLAHVTTWDNEALKHLPTITQGGRPPRYAAEGGIDAFNARTAETKRDLALEVVLEQMRSAHEQLIAYVSNAAPGVTVGRARFLRRLRLDTYGHYRLHAASINDRRLPTLQNIKDP